MVRWHHAIFSAYGFWLPNDPRGSWSDFVGSWELYKFGAATKTTQRRSLAHDAHDARLRLEAKQALKYPPVRFEALQRDAIASGIEQACTESNICVYACAIGFDHVHIVFANHKKSVEQIVGQLKGRASQALKRKQCHPLGNYLDSEGLVPSAWSEGCWKVFINDVPQLRNAIAYVKWHPLKERLPVQNWSFARELEFQ